MNGFKGNGNVFKGNNAKKAGRGRKRRDQNVECDEENEQYARVVSILGGKHVQVLPKGNAEKDTVQATIRGIHFKKVWFKPDDYVVIVNIDGIYEIKGKVTEEDKKTLQSSFENNKTEEEADDGFDFDAI